MVILQDTYMSTAVQGIREAQNEIDPEDARVGETLREYMERNVEMSPAGFLVRRPITQDELAKNVRTFKAPRGVSRQYITHLCSGRRHMSDEVLYAIAQYLGIDPVALKRPDADVHQQRLPIAA